MVGNVTVTGSLEIDVNELLSRLRRYTKRKTEIVRMIGFKSGLTYSVEGDRLERTRHQIEGLVAERDDLHKRISELWKILGVRSVY